MDSKALGQKIKEARLAKKMTQSEVVGSFITRNMLSQIESGTAVPSMKTLSYLANVLDLPPAVLLQEEFSGEAEGTKAPSPDSLQELLSIKELYAAGDFSAIQRELSNLSEDTPLWEEKAAYFARASYEEALRLEKAGELTEALHAATLAEQYAEKGFYANPVLKTNALVLLSRLAETLSKSYLEKNNRS